MRQRIFSRYVFMALILTVLTSLVVTGFYLNHPRAEVLPDTWSYLYVVNLINTTGQLVNYWRLPFYPLFISTIYAVTGQGNLEAVSIAQAVLFVIATLEIYVLAALVFKRNWLALVMGLFVGTNLTLISYVKPLMSEGIGLWLVASLTLTTVLFLKTFRRRLLWLSIFWMLLLFMTRPEWLYLPPFLLAYVLWLAHWKQLLRRFLPHAFAGLVILYAIAGGYIYINTTQNHFAGTTWITNINLVGKILQYNMQDNVDPTDQRAVAISHQIDRHIKEHLHDPYNIMSRDPKLFHDYASEVGKYSQSIIIHHPKTFVLKTIPLFFSSLTPYYQESRVSETGLFNSPLYYLHEISRFLYPVNGVFPLCAVFWLCLFCFKGMRNKTTVQYMGLLVMICTYGIILTTTGGYRDYDYMRLYVLIDPLLFIVVWGTMLLGVSLLLKQQHRHTLIRLLHRIPAQLKIKTTPIA